MENITVEGLFSNVRIKYRIPIYQRHYIWSSNNWVHLWEDIGDMYEKIHGENSDSEDVTSHFSGVIVIHEGRETRKIFDGQQRLTTFQIILCAIRDIFQDAGHNIPAGDVGKLILNNTGESEDERFKLLPRTASDKEAFQALVDRRVNESSSLIYKAYVYFRDAIGNYVSGDEEKLKKLLRVFLEYFYVDEIQIESPRTAAKIFESINGRGQPLAQFDHLRNNLFLRAGGESDFLYRNYWKHFNEESDWRENKVLKSFLENFLQAQLDTKFDSKSALFDLYKREYRKELRERLKLDSTDQASLENFLQEEVGPDFSSLDSELSLKDSFLIVHEFNMLKRYSTCYKELACYKKLADCNPKNPIWFYQFLAKEFETTCWYPLILLLKSEQKELEISDADLESIFEILESYIVRRMLCYGRKWLLKENRPDLLVNELISKIRNQKDFCVNHLETYLKGLRGGTKWPDDTQVNTALHKAGEKNAFLTRYIMFKIEWAIIDPEYKDRPLTSFDGLDREHIMPKGWQAAEGWKVGRGSHQKIRERNRWLHSIGNLTLLNKKVNSKKAKSEAFRTKKEVYKKYSHYKITREVEEHNCWDVQQISERGKKMHKRFCNIWPFPKKA